MTAQDQEIIGLDNQTKAVRATLVIYFSLVKAVLLDLFPLSEGTVAPGTLYSQELFNVQRFELRVDLRHVLQHHVAQFLKISAERVLTKILRIKFVTGVKSLLEVFYLRRDSLRSNSLTVESTAELFHQFFYR